MGATKVLGKLFITPAAVLVSEATKHNNKDRVCKPSELPIYSPENEMYLRKQTEVIEEPNAVEEVFASIRKTITKINCEFKAYKRVGEDYVGAGMDNVAWLKDYLAEEDNTSSKYGAIGIGGLTGFIFGMRGGFFKKVIYTSIGALGMASICYPIEAKEFSAIGIREAKKYATIGYNFIYGVKKDDPPLELPSLPKLPSSISEAWEIASDIGKSASSLVTGQIKEKGQGEK